MHVCLGTPLSLTRYFPSTASIANIRSTIQSYTARDLNREFTTRDAADLVRALAQPASTRVADVRTAQGDATLLSAAGVTQAADPTRVGETGEVTIVLGAIPIPVPPPTAVVPPPPVLRRSQSAPQLRGSTATSPPTLKRSNSATIKLKA